MRSELIKTKISIPNICENHFKRPHLVELLNSSSQGKLILLNAPAGYGKSTLIVEWIQNNKCSFAWYSLAETDNNVRTFLLYLVEALKEIESSIGSKLLDEIEIIDTIGIEAILISLINDLNNFQEQVVIVFDDYHFIEDIDIQKGVAFLLEHIPNNVSLVITTRNSLPLPLTKMRAKNKLIEITENELRFSKEEIGFFVNDYLPYKLSSKKIEIIEEKTEGWVTSLLLLIMSMKKDQNIDDFINSISGNHLLVYDYLLEEVLKNQPLVIQEFLMTTSLLDRFNQSIGSYLLRITKEKTKEIIETLNASNLFMINLDNQREWFRYHHLFKDFLQKRFIEYYNQEAIDLKTFKKASNWFVEHGLTEEAITYSLKAKDYVLSAKLIELKWVDMDLNFKSSIWLNWVKQVPENIINKQPVLLAGYAWALLDNSITLGVKELLNKTINLCEEENTSAIIYDNVTYQKMPSIIYSAKAYLFTMSNEYDKAHDYILKAKRFKKENVYEKRVVDSIMGLALWYRGDLDSAYKLFTNNITSIKMKIGVSSAVGKLLVEQGKLFEAEEYYKDVINLIDNEEGICNQLQPSLLLGLSNISMLKGNKLQALDYLELAKEIGKYNHILSFKYEYYKQLSYIQKYNFNYTDSLSSLSKAEHYYHNQASPVLHSVEYLKYDIYLEQGRNNKTKDINELINIDDLSYMNQQKLVFNLRHLLLLIVKFKKHELLKETIKISEILLKLFDSEDRVLKRIEVNIILSILYELDDKETQSIKSIDKALQIASYEGFKLPFIEYGEFIINMFYEYKNSLPNTKFVFEVRTQIEKVLKYKENKLSPARIELLTPLSKRELEVLTLISRGSSNDEISKELFLAVSTVKNYNRNLFEKLQVKNRTEAVNKAKEYNLI
ncbi:hypothetical protein CI105_06100 [Candidatus Izimaplasma bacterium ZiA1]|uniref:LuxR C-terminal-related transcriptional regulator n=1 Tax=Candidatus Izimoplasma sp. ZiA1 TaxID=2024899 RepID=UPI000BAA7F73|nr:hypothetical protein CI105_06100 [Candidatus Izimaplasma bacterium ZiA1]